MDTADQHASRVLVRAPGKLILSGEHAVVYNRPALVMAVNRFAHAEVTIGTGPGIRMELSDLNVVRHVALEDVHRFGTAYAESYRRFLEGGLEIQEVLDGPAALPLYLLHLLGVHRDITLRIYADIPMGCGMGSSAAIIAATLHAAAAALGHDRDDDTYYALAFEAEKLQHGRPSGVDPFIALHGGLVRFRHGAAEATWPLPARPFFLVQTGVPASTTGECVMQVAKHFEGNRIWDDFEAVVTGWEGALHRADDEALRACVRDNHRLLATLGVVPERVQSFVAAIEERGGAAKISGAGSVRGDHAGMVLVVADEEPADLCVAYGYTLLSIEGEARGVCLVNP